MSWPAGAMAAALRFSSSDDVSDMKRKFLDASVADGRGGEHATGVRAWVVYSVWGRGLSPLPDAQRVCGPTSPTRRQSRIGWRISRSGTPPTSRSDEIYCRMSLQSALRVGVTITSAAGVQPTTRFEQEHLELLPSELEAFGRADVVR